MRSRLTLFLVSLRKFKKKFFHKTSFSASTPLLITQGRLIETGHAYRAFAWTSRLLVFGFFSSVLLNIVFAILFINLFPLKSTEPLLLMVSPKSDQVVRVESFESTSKGFDLMTEVMCQDYVKLRETIDLQTEAQRWERVYWMSSGPVFDIFKNLMNKDGNGAFEKRQQSNVTRSIIILSASTLSDDPRILQVEWQSIDSQNGAEIDRKTWISTLTIQYDPTEVRFEDRYMNPLGFMVTAYGVSEKGSAL